jgi:hypothetical protein
MTLAEYTEDQTGCDAKCSANQMFSCCAYIPSGTVQCRSNTCMGGVTWGNPTSANGKACGEQCSNLAGATSCCYTV